MKTRTIFNVPSILCGVVSLFTVASCSEEEIKKQPVDPGSSGSSINHVVYTAFDESINGKWVAKFSGPCGAMPLSDGLKDAQTTGIVVANGDVYVSGSEVNSKQGYYAKYWKNGVVVLLTDSTSASNSRATSIAVQGEDVYVSGEYFNGTQNVAAYWKNGVVVDLGDGKLESFATDIFLSGDDIYVAGGVVIDRWKGITEARYWKNGVEVKLAGSYASSISVVDNNVYVSGKFGKTPHYYKNSILVDLKEVGDIATSAIVADGDDLYIASPGMYWNNSTKVSLEGASVNALFTLDKQVYAGGFIQVGDKYVARYWKNGEPVDITDGTNNAGVSSVFVVNIE